jgi:hypothetical protein
LSRPLNEKRRKLLYHLNQNTMNRKAEFSVPTDLLTEFVEEMTTRSLKATITGTNEEEDVLLELEYEKDETSEVDELEKFLERLKEEAGHEA